jgi:hypothetical protein
VALVRTDVSGKCIVSMIRLNTRHIIVSSDDVSLFTRVPIKETIDLLGCYFEEFLAIFRHVLITFYSTFNGKFYGQTDGVAMGSPLSPVIANFYMDDYEKVAFESALLNFVTCFAT